MSQPGHHQHTLGPTQVGGVWGEEWLGLPPHV